MPDPARVRLRLLGTGASGGTPGRGRSLRRESSALVEEDVAVLLDLTRDFPAQAQAFERLDALLLTHAHRDAASGVGRFAAGGADGGGGRSRSTFTRARWRRSSPATRGSTTAGLRLVEEGQGFRCGGLAISAVEVPHAADPRFPTSAWRMTSGATVLVYASDVGRLTPELERFSVGADLLVLDGAMWGRTLFSHLRADHARPVVRGWQVDRILLTRSAVPRQRTSSSSGVRALCAKARPAYDGLELRLAGGGRGAAYKTDPSQLRAADAPVPHVDAVTVPNWAHSGRDASVALPRLGRSPAQPPIDLLRGAAGARLGEWDFSLGEPQ